MKCRIDIKGRKIWNDNNNSYGTRPEFTEIVLLRDGEKYDSVRLNSSGDGVFNFPCLVLWKNADEEYVYQVDEEIVPDGYSKAVHYYGL